VSPFWWWYFAFWLWATPLIPLASLVVLAILLRNTRGFLNTGAALTRRDTPDFGLALTAGFSVIGPFLGALGGVLVLALPRFVPGVSDPNLVYGFLPHDGDGAGFFAALWTIALMIVGWLFGVVLALAVAARRARSVADGGRLLVDGDRSRLRFSRIAAVVGALLGFVASVFFVLSAGLG
jgi:hypothetical protein